MATNLDLQAQLNQLLNDQNEILEKTTKLMKDQSSFTREMVNAMRQADYKDVTQDIEETHQAITGVTEATRAMGATQQDVFTNVTSALGEVVDKEDEWNNSHARLAKKLSASAMVVDGFVQGLRFTGNMLHTTADAAFGLVESLGQIAASIIAIPFKMLTGLINMASAGGGDNGLRQALEDIRKEFGALHATSGKAIIGMARSMKGELSQTGLSTYRIFGTLAEKLKTIQEYAHNLGPLFSVLAGQFVKNAEAVGAYYKGLGLTEEGQKGVATRAYALGTAVTEELRQITNYSHQLSKAFNGAAGSAKEISRDMGTLMNDFKHFGGISTKQIAQAVVYFRRLGLEVEKVLGVIEKYDNFEDAANGAAQLSQAFGMNVDALEMMKAQNPAERVEMLRKSFFAAGKSVENMTRQERALLAQQTGLDDAALDLTFSMKNQGMSYDQVTRKADAAKKSQMTQTQAMKALADSIERLVKSGMVGSGGFIDRFLQGFGVGIQRTRDFRGLMRDLRMDLRVAFYEGIKTGRAFEDMFPGIKDVFQGLRSLFEPKKFREMFRNAAQAFKDFFKDMTTNPQTALPKLLDKLKTTFFSWFQVNSPNGQRIVDGFKKFFGAISDIAGVLLKTAMVHLTKGISYITDLISGRKHLSLSGLDSGGFFGRLLMPIIEAVEEAGPALWQAIKNMFTTVWERIKPWLKEHFLDVLGVLAAPSAFAIAGRILASSLSGMFAAGVSGFVREGGIGKAFEAVKNTFTRQVTNATQQAGRAPAAASGGPGMSAAAETIKGAEKAAEAAASSKVNWGLAIAKVVVIALFIVATIKWIIPELLNLAESMQRNKITTQSLLSVTAAMLGVATSLVGISFAVALILKAGETVSVKGIGKALIGLAMIGLVTLAMVEETKSIVDSFKNYRSSEIGKTVTMMGAMGGFFLAAAGVVAIAAAIGIIAIAGSGLGTLAIAAGLLVISLTIEGMVAQGIRIMSAINDFHPGAGFVEKARVFVDVMKGIGSFAASIAQIVQASRPGVLDFLSSSADQQNTLKSVNTVIENLGQQIRLILTTVRTELEHFSGSEEQLKAASSLGTLLGGIAELGNALKPPTEAMEESGWYTTLTGGGEDVSRKIQATTSFIQSMGPQLRLFVRTISEMFTGSGALSHGLTADQERAATVIPGILKGVADFASSLRLGAANIISLSKAGNQENDLHDVGQYIGTLLSYLTESQLFNRIGSVITSIATSVGSLNPEQVKAVQAIAPIVGPAFTAISQIGGLIATMGRPQSNPTPANANAIFQLTNLVSTFFDRIRDDLPKIILGMRDAFANMNVNEATKLAKGMEGLSKVIGVVASLPEVLKGITADNSTGFSGALDRVGSMLAALYLAVDTSTPGTLGSWVAILTPKVSSMVANIEHSHYDRLNTVVTGMVHNVNELATTIRGLTPINIETGLQRLGDSLGLGAKGEYTIQNRNFNINVNFVVKFDNDGLDAFELGLLRRVGPHNTRISHGDLTQ